MRVIVDPDRCEGHARCVEVAPEVFALDADGFSQVILANPGEALRPRIERAVALCPRQAIFLLDDSSADGGSR